MSNTNYNYRATALLVAVSEYDNPDYEHLEEAPTVTKELANALTEGGYRQVCPELLKGGKKYQVEPQIFKWLSGSSNEKRLILYWTGHGKRVPVVIIT